MVLRHRNQGDTTTCMTPLISAEKLSLSDLLKIAWQNRWLILALTVFTAGATYVMQKSRPKIYSAKAYFRTDNALEDYQVLGRDSSNYIALQMAELVGENAGTLLLDQSDREAGLISHAQLQAAQTPGVMVFYVYGADEKAVVKAISGFPSHAERLPFLNALFSRGRERIRSDLAVIERVLQGGPPFGRATAYDPYGSTLKLLTLRGKADEFKRMAAAESFLIRVGEIDGPKVIQSKVRTNSILAGLLGLLVGLGIAVIVRQRSRLS